MPPQQKPKLNFQCNRSMSTDSPYRAWNNHKTKSPQCKTISTEERCLNCFQCISVSNLRLRPDVHGQPLQSMEQSQKQNLQRTSNVRPYPQKKDVDSIALNAYLYPLEAPTNRFASTPSWRPLAQRTWLQKLHTWIPRDCMIQLKTNQSSQSHTTSTENRNQFSIQPLHVSIADFYTQTLLHTDAFTHRHFYTQTPLHTDAFTHRHFYTQTILHTDTFTHRPAFKHRQLLHTEAFTHRSFYTQKLLHTDTFTHRRFYTQTLLHTDSFTHRRFYTQTILHTDAFTHRHFYTQTLLHTDAFTHRRFYTQTLLHTDAFTHRRFYTQTTFTHRRFYTQTLLHTDHFTHRRFYTQTTFTHRRF